MSYIIDFLINWGYWGMFVSAFLAGSFFPFSSEVVMSGLQAAGLDPITIVLGLTRANIIISTISITIGKVLRYVLLVYGLSFIV